MRSIFVLLALSVSAPVLACGGAPCSEENCAMKHLPAGAEADFSRVDDADGTKLALSVSGLKCGKCAAKIIAAVTQIDGVNAVAVDHEAGRAKIAFDAKKVDEAAIRKAITDLGYTPGDTEA